MKEEEEEISTVKNWRAKPKSKHGSTVVCTNGSLVITVMMLVGSFVVGVAEGTSVLKCGDVLGSSYTDIRLE